MGPVSGIQPHVAHRDAGDARTLANGHVTFGTLTRSVRINHRSIRVGSQILLRVPGARLAVDSGNYRDAACARG